MQIYKNSNDLTTALEALAAKDKKLAAAFEEYGTPPLRKRRAGFAGLAQLLISQQVSTAAAATIPFSSSKMQRNNIAKTDDATSEQTDNKEGTEN